jgi:uroporphyrinogen-III decarboxylase
MIRFLRDDIDRLEAYDPSPEDVAAFHAGCDRTQRLIGETVDIFVCPNAPVNYAFNTIGMEPFCFLIHDEPELMGRWLRAAARADLARTDRFADPARSPVCLIYADVAQKGGPIFPPDFLRTHLMPHVRETCDLLHARGMKVVFHSDGDVMSLLPDLVAAGVDGLNPIEIAAGMDIRAIKERFGRKLVLCGGIDVTHLMPHGTPDQVVRATRDLISLAGGDHGLCLGSTTELGWDIPLENIRAMIETVWEYGRYPLRR